MKNTYPIHVIDLRFQVDHINSTKFQLHQEYKGATADAKLFMTILRLGKIKTITNWNKTY